MSEQSSTVRSARTSGLWPWPAPFPVWPTAPVLVVGILLLAGLAGLDAYLRTYEGPRTEGRSFSVCAAPAASAIGGEQEVVVQVMTADGNVVAGGRTERGAIMTFEDLPADVLTVWLDGEPLGTADFQDETSTGNVAILQDGCGDPQS